MRRHLRTIAVSAIVLLGVPALFAGVASGRAPTHAGGLAASEFTPIRAADLAPSRAVAVATDEPTPPVLEAPTRAPDIIYETRVERPPIPTARPRVKQPVERMFEVKPTPKPKPKVRQEKPSGGSKARLTGRSLSGRASYYCRAGVSVCHYRYPDTRGFDAYAAAGPKLRRAICGSDKSNCWRGRVVSVDGISVKLVDWCQCYRGQRHEKVIDLYYDVFRRVGGYVTIKW